MPASFLFRQVTWLLSLPLFWFAGGAPNAPSKPAHRARIDKGGRWGYRVGDYRLICDIQDENITALVLGVGQGKDINR
jgi:mRNA-degrading endonuclease RelE of RelBE toxin-antitoxin system